MRVIHTTDKFADATRASNKPLGLVPTMGALHAGHLALLKLGRTENETLATSIFVNPTQFCSRKDLSKYPRDIESDLIKLEEAGVDLVFTPKVTEIYPGPFDTHVNVGRIGKLLEGAARPGHFNAVATIVCKLLALSRPDRAYFGQKDAQQCLVVKRLNADLNLGVEIKVVPTVREPDGLALSSRNVNLRSQDRDAAAVLYRAILLAQKLHTTNAGEIRSQIKNLIGQEPLAKIEYVSVADPETVEELEEINGPALVSMAVRFGNTRLIDNTIFTP
jgi:pantoate--beta-alanine ligase